jgi:hypothetical protein
MSTAKKAAAKKSAAKKTSAKGGPKKAPAKKSAAHCWPGFQPVAGKEPGTKGSCEPKPKQTAGERKADGKAAAASKLEKAGGSKSKANKS